MANKVKDEEKIDPKNSDFQYKAVPMIAYAMKTGSIIIKLYHQAHNKFFIK